MSTRNIGPMPNISTGLRAALATRVHGPRTAPGVLLAHGGGGSVESNFGSLIPALAEGHAVVAADCPAADEPLDLDELADALVAEAVAHGVEAFTAVGFSMGTAVAVRAAARHPGRVRGLVLAAGLARADNRLRLGLRLWSDAIRGGRPDLFARYVLATAFSARHVNAMTEAQVEEWVTAFAANVRPGAPAQADLIGRVDTTADLARITVPALVVTAIGDLFNDPANSRALAAAIRGAEHVEIDAGHLLMRERPREWIGAVTGFLARHGL